MERTIRYSNRRCHCCPKMAGNLHTKGDAGKKLELVTEHDLRWR